MEKKQIESSCPAFGTEWNPDADECKDCMEIYPDEYEACRQLTDKEQADALAETDEEVPQEAEAEDVTDTEEPTAVEQPSEVDDAAPTVKGGIRLKPPRGSRYAMLVDLLRTGKPWTESGLVEEIHARLPKMAPRGLLFEVSRIIPFLIALGAVVMVGEDEFALNPGLVGSKPDAE